MTISGADSAPVLVSRTPIVLDAADDSNFRNLPPLDRTLHEWAIAQHFLRPTPEMAAECVSELAATPGENELGTKPLVVISTENNSPEYQDLQRKLLRLSQDSRQVVAHDSTHLVLIDEPKIVVDAVREVVEKLRRAQN